MEDGDQTVPEAMEKPIQSSHGQQEDSEENGRDQQGLREHDPRSVAADAEIAPFGGEAEHRSRGVGADGPSDPVFDESGQGAFFGVVQAWRGQLPHPSDFAGYESVLPGAADRILSMAEEANSVRNDSLRKATSAEVDYAKTGQSIALLLTLVAFVASIVFFAVGNPIAGGLFLGFPVIILIRSFLRRPPEDE